MKDALFDLSQNYEYVFRKTGHKNQTVFILNLFIGILPTHRKRNLHLNCLSICVQKRSPVEAPPFVRYCCHNWADNDPYLGTINRPSRNNGSGVWKRRKSKKMSEGESGGINAPCIPSGNPVGEYSTGFFFPAEGTVVS